MLNQTKLRIIYLVLLIVFFSSLTALVSAAKTTKKAVATSPRPVYLSYAHLLGATYYLNLVKKNALGGDLKVFKRISSQISSDWNKRNAGSKKYVAPTPVYLKTTNPFKKNEIKYEVVVRMNPAYCSKLELKSKAKVCDKMYLCLKKVTDLNNKIIADAVKAKKANKKQKKKVPMVFLSKSCFYCKFEVNAKKDAKTGKVTYSGFKLIAANSKNKKNNLKNDKLCTPK